MPKMWAYYAYRSHGAISIMLRRDVIIGELLAIGFVVILCWLIREYEIWGIVCKASSWTVLRIMLGSFVVSVVLRGIR